MSVVDTGAISSDLVQNYNLLGQIGNIHIQAFNIASSASIDTNLRAASIP